MTDGRTAASRLGGGGATPQLSKQVNLKRGPNPLSSRASGQSGTSGTGRGKPLRCCGHQLRTAPEAGK